MAVFYKCILILLSIFILANAKKRCANVNYSIKKFHRYTQMASDLTTYTENNFVSSRSCFDSGKNYNKSIFRSHYYGEKRCDVVSKEDSSHVSSSTICPWYYDITFDRNRNPAIMLDAKCRCLRKEKILKDDDLCNCERLKIAYPVLRRRDSTSNEWKPVKESIGVGCVCKRPIKT